MRRKMWIEASCPSNSAVAVIRRILCIAWNGADGAGWAAASEWCAMSGFAVLVAIGGGATSYTGVGSTDPARVPMPGKPTARELTEPARMECAQ